MSRPAVVEWMGADILDVAPVLRADGDLLVLDATGGVFCVDLQTHAVTRLGTVALPGQGAEEDDRFWFTPRWRLVAAADGTCAAVVFDGGRHGLVVNLQGRFDTTMQLDGGDYYPETVPFSACFMQINGNTVLVHRTAWNRLDASDPHTGRLLTPRGPTEYETPGERPAHYLDYFHGELQSSPGGTRLYDAGWVWHPVGMPCTFDAQAWLSTNVWESEDGPSVQWLGARENWNFPACWVDEHRIAVGGIGDWDDDEFETAAAPPGARIVDMRTPDAKTPDHKLAMATEPQALFSNGRLLFAVHAGSTGAWLVDTGECTEVFGGFAATHYHLRRAELLEVMPRQIRVQAL